MHVVLALLEGEKHGYGIMRDVEQMSDGAVKMGPGTLYGTIARLVADGLIEEVAPAGQTEPGEERRRYYRLTPDGTRVALDEYSRLRTLLRHVGRLQPGLG